MTTSRVAVVTGAGSGVGRRVTQALLEAGYRVALAGRRSGKLHETVAEVAPPGGSGPGGSGPGGSGPGGSGPGGSALVVPTDVGEPDSVAALFDSVRQEWGRVDLLVNNAGAFGPSAAVDEISYLDWQHTVATNLTGAMLCAQQAVRMMKAQRPRGGRIINNGSISAHSPRPNSVAYTATKHAMTGLTKSISLDGRAYDIACGQIDIGNAATEMTEGIARGARQADGSLAAEPTFDAEHVARAVLFMADLPLDTNVQFMTITATKMPFIGRG